MSVTLEAGKFYRTQDGRKAGPMRGSKETDFHCRSDDPELRAQVWKHNGAIWGEQIGEKGQRIVAEWTDAPTGPVRTVTRKEIVPGSYGHIWVDRTDMDMVMLGMRDNALKKLPSVGLSVGELRAAIATLTEIADALEAPSQ